MPSGSWPRRGSAARLFSVTHEHQCKQFQHRVFLWRLSNDSGGEFVAKFSFAIATIIHVLKGHSHCADNASHYVAALVVYALVIVGFIGVNQFAFIAQDTGHTPAKV